MAIDVIVGRQAREERAPVHVVEAERWVAVHEHSAALDHRQRWQACAIIAQVGEFSQITRPVLRVFTRKLGDGCGAKTSRKWKGPIEAASIVQMLRYFWRLSGLLIEHPAKGKIKVSYFVLNYAHEKYKYNYENVNPYFTSMSPTQRPLCVLKPRLLFEAWMAMASLFLD